MHHWMLSSDPEEVKVFVACHFCGLQAEHKWNQDPAVWPLYHDGPCKGMLCCPLKLQVIFDWLDNNCPDEVIYSSLHWHMEMPVFKQILAHLKTQSAAGLSSLSYTVLLSSTDKFLMMCLSFINLFLHTGGLGPLQWLQSDITVIPKSSEVGQGINSSCPIGLMEVLGKIAMSFLDKQVMQVWHKKQVLSPYQFGFQQHHGVAEATCMVFDVLQFGCTKGQDLWAALSDVQCSIPQCSSLGVA